MSNVNGKKEALLTYKQKVLEEIRYYNESIEELRANRKNNRYYDEFDSSDTEDLFLHAIEPGPSVPQLKQQQETLKTCLQATEELTGLTVLQSEVNILVQEPQLKGECPIIEPGTWKEILAECKIDLVTFTITFFTHTADRKFAPTLYRGLQLQLVKACHEVELSNSVLHTLKRPSDAVEVIRSYAAAYRSRRTTLAHLANKYANSLFMEPHPDGGFVLKCANLLEILWRLENKWSPVALFNHRMKFDVEYMDEAYIKIITQAHKQLMDPSIQTDERTLLLSKIIDTCLQARGPVDSESDLESVGVKSKQTETQVEVDPKDKEVMAPPKSLPKKTKNAVGKDKNVSKDKNAAQKRSLEDDKVEGNGKKVKTADDGNVKRNVKGKEKSGDLKNNRDSNKANERDNILKTSESNDPKKTLKGKESIGGLSKVSNKKSNKDTINGPKKSNDKNDILTKNIENTDDINTKSKKNERKNEVNTQTKNSESIINVKQSNNAKNNDSNGKVEGGDGETHAKKAKTNVNINKNDKPIGNCNNKQVESVNDNIDEIINQKTNEIGQTEEINKTDIPIKKIDKKTKMSVANDKKFDVITKKAANIENRNNDNSKKDNNNVVSIENPSNKAINSTDKKLTSNTKESESQKGKNVDKKSTTNTKPTHTITKSTEAEKNKNTGNTSSQIVKKFTEKNANTIKNTDKVSNMVKKTDNIVKDKQKYLKKPENSSKNNLMTKKLSTLTMKTVKNINRKSANKTPLKLQNSQKTGNTKTSGSNDKIIGNTEKENSGKFSKIPQRKLSTDNESHFKKNILRISPRKLPSKTTSQHTTKFMTKTTNIPRLMKKPVSKIIK